MHILLAHNRLYPQSGGIGTSLFFGGRELLASLKTAIKNRETVT